MWATATGFGGETFTHGFGRFPLRSVCALMRFMKCFRTRLVKDDETRGCYLELPFDPKEAFGRRRAPVRVTIGTYSFRTTTASMGGCFMVGVRREHREAAGCEAGDEADVAIELDIAPRTVEAPDDLRAALAEAGLEGAWAKLSYTHQREHVEAIEDAKKPETRARRIAAAVTKLHAP